ncbi:MAG: HlyD family efflux transporter periplasmic adaptor subunit [Verrucomicrobiota bacterium]
MKSFLQQLFDNWKFSPETIKQWLLENRLYFAAVIGCGCIGLAILIKIFWPAYQQPENRMYTSKLGYANLNRQLGGKFNVETARAEPKVLTRTLIGEGYFATQNVLVPIIPLARILSVHVEEGDTVKRGQLLATLDTSKIEIKLRSAKLAVETAKAELSRVEIGSAYVLAQERPEKDQIGKTAASKHLAILKEEEQVYIKLVKKGAIPKNTLLELQKRIIVAEAELAEAQFNFDMSSRGQPKSRRIAENAIQEATNALEHRLLEFKDYKIYAPCDGIIERVLIQPAEYNQDTGKPAFVIASDLWFEAHLDQTALNHVAEGDTSIVHLEALPHHDLRGKVTKIIPVVTFNQGGPEANRPIRPRGTGAPEWPSTFKVRISIDESDLESKLTPGMTGFAKIETQRTVVAVPLESVTSRSAGRGVIHHLTAEGWASKVVPFGIMEKGWIEIKNGITESTVVLTNGQHTLEEGDSIRIVEGPVYSSLQSPDLVTSNP